MFIAYSKKYFLLAVVICTALLAPKITRAETKETVTPSPSPDVQGIRDKAKEIVQEKIAALRQGKEMGFAGKVSSIKANGFSLITKGESINILVNEESQIVNQKRQEIAVDKLKEETEVIVMGFLNAENVLEAKRVVETAPTTKKAVREIAFGRVDDISMDGEKILTVKNEKKQTGYTVEVSETTTISKKTDGKVEKTQFEDIKKGDFVIAIGAPAKNQPTIITAKIIHVIPTNRPTPTISPKATPSVKAAPAIKATPSPKTTPTI